MPFSNSPTPLLDASGAVGSVPSLSLEPIFRRSHGSLYKALSLGEIDEGALRAALVAHRPGEWPAVFAVDASTWERCDAECSPERGFYYSASKHSAGQPIVAGWSYQWIAQLSFEPNSWTAPLDALRIAPGADATEATIAQVKALVALLREDRAVPSSSSTPVMTPSPSAMGWTTPRPRCWCASERTGSSTTIRRRGPIGRRAPVGGLPATGAA